MERHSLVGRTGKGGWRGGYQGASRDYADPVACAATACPVNTKRGTCGSPAMAILNSEAQCDTFLSFKKLPPPQKRHGYCRQCGGCVKLVDGKWIHDGENLSHEVVL